MSNRLHNQKLLEYKVNGLLILAHALGVSRPGIIEVRDRGSIWITKLFSQQFTKIPNSEERKAIPSSIKHPFLKLRSLKKQTKRFFANLFAKKNRDLHSKSELTSQPIQFYEQLNKMQCR